MAYDEGLAERVRAHFEDAPDMTEKNMFGGRCFLKRGHYCVGVSGESLMARVGPDGYAAALERPHAAPKMKTPDQKMTGYVMVSPAGLEEDEALAAWLDECAAFVETLPPK